MGGLGLSHIAKAVMFEEAGYSLLGPVALNIHAPDEGNIHLMEVVATPAQKERWLAPLVAGRTRSCFCMTEPPPGAGSDPSMLKTTAVRDGDDYVINGHKWFITGAEGAAFAIIMARMEDGNATMFLTDMDRPGIASCATWTPGRVLHRRARRAAFNDLRVPANDILGEVGQGLPLRAGAAGAGAPHPLHALARARRAARTTSRSTTRAARQAFGKPLVEHEGVGFMLADNDMDLRIARLLIRHTAWLLDQGERAPRIEPRQGDRSPKRVAASSTAACRSWAARASPARPW